MFSGVSGDMLLGACLDAGVRVSELQEALSPLGLKGVRLASEAVERHGIAATRCRVDVQDVQGHRRLAEILEVIERADLQPSVAERSVAVFERLAAAEGEVHGSSPEDVRFHEVGALDAIVDVVGGVWCLERLGIEEIYASRFTVGRGWIDGSHGRLPVPAPAVMELVQGWPIVEADVDAELTTPTGAAMVTELADGRGMPADFVPETVGYGAGSREFDQRPNLLRLVIGTTADRRETLSVVECDLDDLSPQLFEPLAEALYAAGAREVHWVPVQMKKQRPGVTVRALVPTPWVPDVGRALTRETTSIGYRFWAVGRETVERETVEIETSWGPVAAKRVRKWDGGWEVRPEYDACRSIARRLNLPVRDVMRSLWIELNPTAGEA